MSKKIYDGIDALENVPDEIKEQLKNAIKGEISNVNSEAANYRTEFNGIQTEFNDLKTMMENFTKTAAPETADKDFDVNDFTRIANEVKDLKVYKEASVAEKARMEKEILQKTVNNELSKQLKGLPDPIIDLITSKHSPEFIKTTSGVIQTADGRTLEQRAQELLTDYESLKVNTLPSGGGLVGDRGSEQNGGGELSELDKVKAQIKQLQTQ